MKKLAVLSAMAIVAAVLVAAPQQEQKTPADAPAAVKVESLAPAAPQNPDKVIVTVNGEKIRERQIFDEVEKILQAQMKNMPAGWEISQERLDGIRQRLRDQVKRGLVDQTVILQEFKKQGFKITDEQVNSRIDEMAKGSNLTREEFIKQITAQYGLTEQQMKDEILPVMKEEALIEANMKGPAVTEADARKLYDEHSDTFVGQEGQIHARHILAGKRGLTPEEKPAMLEKIKKAQARLKAGEKFEDVARDMSDCPSSERDGDLGFFGRGQMDPAFEKAAYELEIGQTGDIVESSFGYHIIKREGPIAFGEVKDQLIAYLENQNKQMFRQEYRAKLTDAAKVEWAEGEEPTPPPAMFPQVQPPAPADNPQTDKPAESAPKGK
jgi:peptidyl-prolyl cis-trans isomerase C